KSCLRCLDEYLLGSFLWAEPDLRLDYLGERLAFGAYHQLERRGPGRERRFIRSYCENHSEQRPIHYQQHLLAGCSGASAASVHYRWFIDSLSRFHQRLQRTVRNGELRVVGQWRVNHL